MKVTYELNSTGNTEVFVYTLPKEETEIDRVFKLCKYNCKDENNMSYFLNEFFILKDKSLKINFRLTPDQDRNYFENKISSVVSEI